MTAVQTYPPTPASRSTRTGLPDAPARYSGHRGSPFRGVEVNATIIHELERPALLISPLICSFSSTFRTQMWELHPVDIFTYLHFLRWMSLMWLPAPRSGRRSSASCGAASCPRSAARVTIPLPTRRSCRGSRRSWTGRLRSTRTPGAPKPSTASIERNIRMRSEISWGSSSMSPSYSPVTTRAMASTTSRVCSDSHRR